MNHMRQAWRQRERWSEATNIRSQNGFGCHDMTATQEPQREYAGSSAANKHYTTELNNKRPATMQRRRSAESQCACSQKKVGKKPDLLAAQQDIEEVLKDDEARIVVELALLRDGDTRHETRQ
jgi:hypothetical protein